MPSRDFKLLAGIERPGRYIAGEFGLPPVRMGGRLHVVMGFPDVYEVGMSHLGFRLLHAHLASRADLQVERVFLPWPDLQLRLQRDHEPLATLETGTPLREVDLLGLSLQYELAQPAVLRLLDLAGIPRRAADRASDRGGAAARRWPIVLVGGSGALNPEPLAPFCDAFFVGEADEAMDEIVEVLAALRDAPRAARLERLGAVEGIYVPEHYDAQHEPDRVAARLVPRAATTPPTVHRRYVADLDGLPLPAVSLVPYCSLVHDRVAIEIQRGCCRGCRFCQAGFVTRPTRQRSTARVLQLARDQLRLTGYEDLSLLSLSAGDHPELQRMLAALFEEHGPARVAVSLPSLRTESLAPILSAYLSKVRKAGFTLAPEAGSERLRRVINKGNSEANLLESVRSVVRAGFSQLKLYFMIGLPTETDEDVLAIAELATRAQEEAHAISRSARLTASISTFVPKPHTSFQWEAAPDLAQIQHKQALLQARMPRRIKLKWHDAGQSLIEAYLSRGDRRLATVLERVVTPEHSGMDAWTEHFELARWERALSEAQQAGEIPPAQRYLQARPIDDPLPWDHIDVGIERRYLAADRAAALAGRPRTDCTDGSCDQCGVCPETPLHRVADGEPRGVGEPAGRTGALCAPGGVGEGAQPREGGLPRVGGEPAGRTGALCAPGGVEGEGGLPRVGGEPAGRTGALCAPGGVEGEGGLPRVGEGVEGEGANGRSSAPGNGRSSAPGNGRLVRPGTTGGVHRVRVWYHKLGRARFLSHLELASALERAARRARLPLAFSAGYHPKPKLSFSPALPLGAESMCEFVELELTGSLAVEAAAGRLAAQLPPGVELQRGEEAPHSLLPLINGVRWRFALEPGAPELEPLLERARRRLRGGLVLQRRGGRERDLSAIVLDLVPLDAACFEARCAFAQDGAGTVRPAELLGALLDLDDDAAGRTRITRAGWILEVTP